MEEHYLMNKKTIDDVNASITGKNKLRDRALFQLAVRTGWRMSEILSLKVKDLMENGRMVDRLKIEMQTMSEKSFIQSIILHKDAKEAVKKWLEDKRCRTGRNLDPETYVFSSQSCDDRPLSRSLASRIFRDIWRSCGFAERQGAYALRKVFMSNIYKKLGGDVYKLERALLFGRYHPVLNPSSSSVDQEIDAAVLED